MRQFTPISNTDGTVVTAASQAVAITKPAGEPGTMRLFYDDTVPCFVVFGKSSAVTAVATTSHPIPGGAAGTQDIEIGPNITHYAVIGTANVKKLYSTFGKAI